VHRNLLYVSYGLIPCEWLGERGGLAVMESKRNVVPKRILRTRLTDASGGWAGLLGHGSHLLMIRTEYRAITHVE
jgi:hypothetical protein